MNTSMQPSDGDVIDHFVNGLKFKEKAWVIQQAPANELWTNPKDVFQKALQYETNFAYQDKVVAAMPRANVSYKRKSKHFAAEPIKFGSFHPGEVLPAGPQANVATRPQKRKRFEPRGKGKMPIPSEVFKKRIEQRQCTKCGQDDHVYKDCMCKDVVLPSWYKPSA